MNQDTFWTKYTQEKFGNIEIGFIERMEDSYFIENPMIYVYETDLQSIDKCEIVELQDVPIEVTRCMHTGRRSS